jgi:hypothetical protein
MTTDVPSYWSDCLAIDRDRRALAYTVNSPVTLPIAASRKVRLQSMGRNVGHGVNEGCARA